MKMNVRLLATGAAVLCAMSVIQPMPAMASTSGVSVKAPLPASAYAGLACDVTDSRLKRTALPNGVGPEARVAAACMRLEWLSRASARVPKITVLTSKGYPAERAKRISKGIAAGHRLFGAYADVTQYVALASRDAAYSCKKGEEITKGRLVYSQNIRAWDQAYNSGCPGTDYSPSGWTSTILDPGGKTYFAWTLTKSESSNHFSSDAVLGPMWFLGAVSHEYVHSVQMQRSMSVTNGQESLGRWYGEGQAQYLGNTAAAYTIGPATIRDAQLAQLREVMKQEGVTRIDLEQLADNWSTGLVYPAGYFAYEWLVAHYGLERTFTWWNEWNEGCERPGSGTCWRERAPELFGMSASDLMRELNAYVNAQVKP